MWIEEGGWRGRWDVGGWRGEKRGEVMMNNKETRYNGG